MLEYDNCDDIQTTLEARGHMNIWILLIVHLTVPDDKIGFWNGYYLLHMLC